MWQSTRLQLAAATLIAVAALFGWLVGSGRLDVILQADPPKVERPAPPAVIEPAPVDRAKPLAQAEVAQAKEKQPTTAAGAKPNILVIIGDDIGQTNVSAYSMGLMGYRTPNIDRIAKEGMIFTDYYAEQSCTAGRSTSSPASAPSAPGSRKVGVPGSHGRLAEGGPDHRRAAQEPRLRHRPVRQEPPGRPERVPADRPRLRRVLRQPLPPQRRGGAGAADLSRRRSSARCSARAACSSARPSDKDDPTEHPRWGRVGKQTIEDTGPLTKKRMETIDDETVRRGRRFHQAAGEGRQAVLLLAQQHPHALLHPRQGRPPQPAGPDLAHRVRRRHGRARRPRRQAAQGARRPGHRRQHHRPVHDRQRPAQEHLAGRRHLAVPQREEHQLGRCVPRALRDPLAGQDQGRQRRPTRSSAVTTGSRPSSPPPASPTSRRSCSRATRRPARSSRSTSTATTSCRT